MSSLQIGLIQIWTGTYTFLRTVLRQVGQEAYLTGPDVAEGEAAIAQYRNLMLDADHEVVGISLNVAATDEAALAAARAWLAKHLAVEVWDGSRVVGTLINAGVGQRRCPPPGVPPFRG